MSQVSQVSPSLSLLLKLSSAPLIHVNPPSILPNFISFPHTPFQVSFSAKNTFHAFSELPANLRSFPSQSTIKERPFDADCEKKFTQPGLHANGNCLSVVNLPHIGNCITQFPGQHPSTQKNELVRKVKSVFKKTYKVLFPGNISKKCYYQYFEISNNLVASWNYIWIGKKYLSIVASSFYYRVRHEKNCSSLIFSFFLANDKTHSFCNKSKCQQR